MKGNKRDLQKEKDSNTRTQPQGTTKCETTNMADRDAYFRP